MSGATRHSTISKRHGVWFVENGTVLSDVRRTPGATGGLFDVLAACISALKPGGRSGILGFGAGGVVAPLRALDSGARVEGVDLSLRGEQVFRKTSEYPVDDVQVERGDALEWLGRRRSRFDLLLDDLSVPHRTHEVVKPAVSLDSIPSLAIRRLVRDGVLLVDVLPTPGYSWAELFRLCSGSLRSVRVVTLEEYHNRVLIAGNRLPSARETSRRITSQLNRLRSRQHRLVSVRTIR